MVHESSRVQLHVRIDEGLFLLLKGLSAKHRRPLGEVVQDLLALGLLEGDSATVKTLGTGQVFNHFREVLARADRRAKDGHDKAQKEGRHSGGNE